MSTATLPPVASPANYLPIGSEGYYLVRIVDHAIDLKKTGAVQIGAHLAVCYEFDFEAEQWQDISAQSMGMTTYWNLRGRDDKGGTINQSLAKLLASLFGWRTGNVEELAGMDLSSAYIQVRVQTRPDDQGRDKLEANWPSLPQPDPRKRSNMASDPAVLKQINAKVGSQLRALVGNVQPATETVPGWLASAPVGTATVPAQESTGEVPAWMTDPTPDDEVPF